MKNSILITGGSGKVGKCLVKHFLKQEWSVLFTSTSEQGVLAMQDLFGSPDLHGYVADFLLPDMPRQLVTTVLETFGPVQHLVNNARSLKSLTVGQDGVTARHHFQEELLMDVIVPYELSMALFSRQANALHSIVNIGSQYGVVAPNLGLYDDPKGSAIQYGVSKAALGHLTKELAVRLASGNIRVNCVAYGGVEGRVDEAFKARYAALCPSGKMLREADIAGPVDFLVSTGSAGVTGHSLVVDGGWSVW